MKIVIDCRMISMSGIGRYIKDIVPQVCATFDDVVLIGNLVELSTFQYAYSSVSILEIDAPIYSVKEQFQLWKKIPKCDIFWSPHYNVPIFSLKAKKRVVTIHDAFHLAFLSQLPLVQKIYAKIVLNSALKKSNKVITISSFSKSEIIKYTAIKYTDKIEIIYRCVSDAVQQNQKKTSDILISDRNKYFLFVGNVKPHKNLKRALEAFKMLILENKENTKKVIFKIVGKRDGFITGDTEIQELVENDAILNTVVQFTGHLSDTELEDLYKNAVCLVFPSYYEGFGLPPLEAMALGCPTITSNAASLPEICGDATLYFDPFNITEISRQMSLVLFSESIRANLQVKGYEQVKKFSWNEAIEKHIHLFKSLK